MLGGGITGCLTACLLADDGLDVVIIEQRPQLMEAASRWNDGKIHLGYTFQGTPSLATAALMQEGAAVFLPILEQVLGTPVPAGAFGGPVVYLVDEASLVSPDTLWERARSVAELLAGSLDRLPGLQRFARAEPLLERLDPVSASLLTGQAGVAAAWRTSEVHVSAGVVAELVRATVERRDISVITGRADRIVSGGRQWHVTTGDLDVIMADAVINCTWEGRAVLDRQVRTATDPVSIRYKHCLLGRTTSIPAGWQSSTRILGRFGDVAIYRNGEAYLSWYPAAMIARSDDGTPPLVPAVDERAMVEATLQGLGLPVTEGTAADWRVGGGYVVAHGYGDIDRLDSPLHDRSRPAVVELAPGYLTVDTGKYTLGPMLARKAARAVVSLLAAQPRVPSL